MKKLILIAFISYAFISLHSQAWKLLSKEVANDRETNDYFGYSVAINGSYAVVGAYQEDPDSKANAGAAYIFKNVNGNWQQVQKIVASDRADLDNFGISVAINGDYIIVGAMKESHDSVGTGTASAAGSAYIFKNISGTWTQVKKIVAADRSANDNFGSSVAISGDYIIVGAKNDSQDSANLNILSGAGSAYIFKNFSGNWYPLKKLSAKSGRLATDNFGTSVSIDGDYAVVGASGNNGAAYVFKKYNDKWYQTKITTSGIISGDEFGASVSVKGDYILIGAPSEDEDSNESNTLTSSGSAYLFKNISETWTRQQKLCAEIRGAGYNFGNSVSLGTNHLVVGTKRTDTDAGAVYVFSNTSLTWISRGYFTAPDAATSDYLGCSVSMDGKYLISGAYLQDKDSTYSNSITDAGAAYVYVCDTVQATNINVSSVNSYNATLSWTKGALTNNAVFLKATNTGQASPEANTTYTANSKFKSGSEIGTSGWYCIHKDLSCSANVTNLVPNTTYRVMVCDFFGTDGNECYNINTAINNPLNFTTPKLNQTITLDTIVTKKYSSADSAVSAHSSLGLPVTITSSNENIVKIEGGQIKIVGVGQCKVFARHPGNDTVFAAADSQLVTVTKTKLLAQPVNTTREFGEANPVFQSSYSGFRTGETEAVIDTKPVNSCTANATSPIGLHIIQISGGTDDHYYFEYDTGSLIITKAPLTITVDDKKRLYGSSDPLFTFKSNGLKNNDSVKTIQVSVASTAESDAGNYTLSGSLANFFSGQATNYSISYVDGSLKINPAPLFISMKNSPVEKLYGNANPAFNFETSGLKNTDSISSVTFTTSANNTSDIGTYTVSLSNAVFNIGKASNYTITYNAGNLKVNTMPLTITADAKTRTFGENNPPFTWKKTALRNNDSIKQVSISTTAVPRSPIGTYDIVPSSAVFETGKTSNYSITYEKGSLTITESPIQICLVTIDMESGNSMVVWEKNNTAGFKGYNVYRQKSSVGEYEKINEVLISKTGIFVDSTSAIERHAEQYKITTVDANSVESRLDQCNYHKSLFLQYSGSVGGVNLTWQPYEIENSVINFKSYIIYKGSDSTKLTVVDTVASNIYNFTDNDPLSQVYKYYYRIAGVKYDACYPDGHRKAGAGPFLESISNMEDNKLKATQELKYIQKNSFDLVVSPNPVRDISSIRYLLPQTADVKAQIVNMLGKIVATINIGNQVEGNAQFYINANKLNLSNGLYYLKVNAGKYEATSKISVVR